MTYLPKPLPGVKLPSPAWHDAVVARATVRAHGQSYQMDLRPSPIRNNEFTRGVGIPVEGDPTFHRLKTSSVAEALKSVPQLVSRLRPNVQDPGSPAIALMQAQDGALYMSHLKGRGRLFDIDIPKGASLIKSIDSPHPDLKAIVGTNSWVEFTDPVDSPPPTVIGVVKGPRPGWRAY